MTAKSQFEWIDFLRGVSALAVVFFHVRVDLWVGWNAIRAAPHSYSLVDRATALLSIPMPFFGSAVMLFFLVSGFCIHYPYAGGRSLDLKSYGIRRFLRIYPPYLGAVVLGIILEFYLYREQGVTAPAMTTAIKTLLMLQNFGPHAGQMAVNPSLWSLPVEVELYLAYPLFFWLLTRYGGRRTLAVVALISAIAVGLSLNSRWEASLNMSGHFAAYWIIWCAGAMLAEGVRRGSLPQWSPTFWLIMLVVLTLAILADVCKAPLGLLHLLWAGFYFTMMLWGLTRSNPLARVPARGRRWLLV